ncbi:MAG: hypothetical protein ACI9O0_000853 [Paracoccaceae bacterium]|jgi:hypothetical protein
MKPNFALNLSFESIVLAHRTAEGWREVGKTDLRTADLDLALTYLHRLMTEISPEVQYTKLIIPNSEILYIEVSAPGPLAATRRAEISNELEGRTPYNVEDLIFDWWGMGTIVQVAVVARDTLIEAEAFARRYNFNPVSFVAIPNADNFPSEPFFGLTEIADFLIPDGERLLRDQDPIRILPALPSGDFEPAPPLSSFGLDLPTEPQAIGSETGLDTNYDAAEIKNLNILADPISAFEPEDAFFSRHTEEFQTKGPSPVQLEVDGAKNPLKTLALSSKVEQSLFLFFTRVKIFFLSCLNTLGWLLFYPFRLATRVSLNVGAAIALFVRSRVERALFVLNRFFNRIREHILEGFTNLGDDFVLWVSKKKIWVKQALATTTTTFYLSLHSLLGFGLLTLKTIAQAPVYAFEQSLSAAHRHVRAINETIEKNIRQIANRLHLWHDAVLSAISSLGDKITASVLRTSLIVHQKVKALGRLCLLLFLKLTPNYYGQTLGRLALSVLFFGASLGIGQWSYTKLVTIITMTSLDAPRNVSPVAPVLAQLEPFRSENPAHLTTSSNKVNSQSRAPRMPKARIEPEVPVFYAPQGDLLDFYQAPNHSGSKTVFLNGAVDYGSWPDLGPLSALAPLTTLSGANLKSSFGIIPNENSLPDPQTTPLFLLSPNSLIGVVTSAGFAPLAAASSAEPMRPLQPIADLLVKITLNQDEILLTMNDPAAQVQEAGVLPQLLLQQDYLPYVSLNSTSEAALQNLKTTPIRAPGSILLTKEGQLSDQGVMIYAGKPKNIPPNRPDQLVAKNLAKYPPFDPELAKVLPKARPENLNAPIVTDANVEDVPDIRLATLRPRPRPASFEIIATKNALARETEPLSRLALISSPRPRARPNGLTLSKPAVIAKSRGKSGPVSQKATEKNMINLSKVALIGVYGTDSNRYALVRQPNGRFVKVSVGDQLDGGRVAAITGKELRYQKSGQMVALSMPKG